MQRIYEMRIMNFKRIDKLSIVLFALLLTACDMSSRSALPQPESVSQAQALKDAIHLSTKNDAGTMLAARPCRMRYMAIIYDTQTIRLARLF